MHWKSSSIPVLAAAMLATGCLHGETTHTLYLSPDGAVAWVATERNVYSDADDLSARRAEEQEFIAAAAAGRHPVALALEAMGPAGHVRTTIVREERPFFVVTDTRFQSIDAVLRQLFEAAPCTVSVHRSAAGRQSTLTIDLDFGIDPRMPETPVSAIADEIEGLQIVLTGGRFVSAIGFDIQDGSARFSEAWMKQTEEADNEGETVHLTLVWEDLTNR